MNLFELFAKLTLDDSEYKKGVSSAESSFSGLVSSVGKGVKAIGKGAIAAAKVAGTALVAGATAVASISKLALDGYAEYEQLVGGVETLFGAGGKSLEEYAQSVGKSVNKASKDYEKLMAAQTTVLQNADNAYMTAGMSANEYINTVTSFSASLLQGLGGDTVKAAKIADKAITDMSDNANKMGTDISMIQNAYQGFAKQNYTMLDNLKLGYGGTASEMARLINDSGVLGKSMTVEAKTVNEVSFDKIIEAIGVIQTRMGITGTTAAEAATTIQGSVSSMKAAWTNLVTGLADPNKDIGQLTDNLVNSVITVAGNVGPKLLTILPNIGKGLKSLTKKLIPEIKKFVKDIGPDLLEGVVDLIDDLAEELPELLNDAVDAIPDLIDAGLSIIGKLGDALLTSLPTLMTKIENLIKSVDWQQVGDKLYEGLKSIEWSDVFQRVASFIGTAIGGVGAFLWGFIKGGIADMGNLIKTWVDEGAAEGKTAGQSILDGIAKGFDGMRDWVFDNIVSPLIEAMVTSFTGSEEAGKQAAESFVEGWKSFFNKIPSLWDLADAAVKGIAYSGSGGSPYVYYNGSHANGLSYVPYDGYIAELHQGERVLTRKEAAQYGNRVGGNTINITVNGARYMDEDTLAAVIAEKINFEMEKEAYAFA